MSAEPEDWRRPAGDAEYFHNPPQGRRDRIDRAVDIMARPGARTWFVLVVVALYFGLWLFGFDNVMDRVGLTRPAAIEQMRMME